MLETMLGIWMFLLTAGVGFVWGRFGQRLRKQAKPREQYPADTVREIGWQELLNFLNYDGSGKLPSQTTERRDVNGETKDHTGTDRAGIRPRRPI